jgi:capsular exopolysaccharide synthesis family protein
VSRIQDILNKAERDGAMRRTHSPADEAAAGAPPVIVGGTLAQSRPAEPAPAPMPSRPGSGAPPVRAADAPAAPDTPRVVPAGTLSPMLVAALAPHAVAAEQYRSLRTRIALSDNGHGRRVIAVTSPSLGDGKSVTASNLALTMAQEVNRRVVLVDADLRRPTVHSLFGLPQQPGLAEVLAGDATLEEAVVELPDYRLTIVTAGVPPERPAELLGSAAMRRVLDALRSRFDRVVLDTPPVLPLADVGVLAPLTDGVLLVVRAAVTQKPLVERALAAFDQGRLLGLVLNGTGADDREYGQYGGYLPR